MKNLTLNQLVEKQAELDRSQPHLNIMFDGGVPFVKSEW